ncbi:hypothetical protein BDP81DRAFT_183700 [Colletotrichum phormii]|uniref:Uncharacterized protein n=1 Tax=Colletotrichum phormii TaxID=359342 RepID=A0AAJ0EI97_9PEZI|nr:uncharacterized protein BDP81DRAFT_183700 [Colletotrichum phormii]KAK1639789.1 hypothetical protein BDP81DRAFT_183700 [Colletotrichum phormii]
MIRHRRLALHNLWILLWRLTYPSLLSMKMFRMMAFVRYRELEARVAGRVFILVWRARPGMWLTCLSRTVTGYRLKLWDWLSCL